MPASPEEGTEARRWAKESTAARTLGATGAGSATASVHLGAASDANAAATWHYNDKECKEKQCSGHAGCGARMPQPMPQTDVPPPYPSRVMQYRATGLSYTSRSGTTFNTSTNDSWLVAPTKRHPADVGAVQFSDVVRFLPPLTSSASLPLAYLTPRPVSRYVPVGGVDVSFRHRPLLPRSLPPRQPTRLRPPSNVGLRRTHSDWLMAFIPPRPLIARPTRPPSIVVAAVRPPSDIDHAPRLAKPHFVLHSTATVLQVLVLPL